MADAGRKQPAKSPPRRANVTKGGQIHVIKVGTSTLLTNDENGAQQANLSNIARLIEVIAALRKKGDHVILVSSGAVGMGCLKLGLKERPQNLGGKQAMAAAGQSRLMRLYEDLFRVVNLQVAQLLIVREDFSDKLRFRAVRSTIDELIRLGVVPIINENDSLAAPHLSNFGDNDTMAAMTAALVEADWLFLATDVHFLYTANPKTDPSAKPIYVVKDVASLQIGGLEASSSQWGTGGMATKLIAASIAVCAGVHCGLVNGAEPERISQLIGGNREGGTHFVARVSPDVIGEGMHGRWILALPLAGRVSIGPAGYNSVLRGNNLLFRDVLTASGNFEPDQAVALVSEGKEVARALFRSSCASITDALKKRADAQPSDKLGLKDFTSELRAAGVFLDAYRSWRQGSHRGAKGEMTGEKIKQLGEQQGIEENESSSSVLEVVAWASDIVLTSVGAMNEAEKVMSSTHSNKRGRSASPDALERKSSKVNTA
eukprot:TRINITY_DN2018_c0_g1_i8.p1 TRINITY_DN2018_c0_g1~~TRINITY_DN2018_c0_g1_i8.p1  ORF type:complete len:509 (-),score=95.58 TRINITY_DN2018_c0_g1_i8:108-1571(-)